jgi:hydrogenase maturation protease
LALEYLAELGVAPLADAAPEPPVAGLSATMPHPALDLAAYESGRPSPALACRIGDERLLSRLATELAGS